MVNVVVCCAGFLPRSLVFASLTFTEFGLIEQPIRRGVQPMPSLVSAPVYAHVKMAK